MGAGGNERRRIRLSLVADIIPVDKEDAVQPGWYIVFKSAQASNYKAHELAGHIASEPILNRFWLPRIKLAVEAEYEASEIRERERVEAAKRGGGNSRNIGYRAGGRSRGRRSG